jgi:hypothetical protein
VTLIVTVLHCTSLQEITSGEKLLTWGFAMDGKVRPVGELVSPLPAVTTSRVARHPAGQRAGTPATTAADAPASSGLPAGPLAATCSLALIAGLGGAWLLRQRRSPAASARGAPLRSPPADSDPGQPAPRQDPATPGGGIRSGP